MTTPISSLPEIAESQAGKDITHNTALRYLEALCFRVISRTTTAPPAVVDGATYLIPAGATGAWAAYVGKIALGISSAWTYLTPYEGLRLWVNDQNVTIRFDGSTWSSGITFSDGDNIQTDTTTGTKIGTATTQKISLWNATPIVQPASADQAAVTLGNADSEIGGLTISAAYDQLEVQALRDKCEELADDVRALSTLIHGMRTAMVNSGMMKGSA